MPFTCNLRFDIVTEEAVKKLKEVMSFNENMAGVKNEANLWSYIDKEGK